MYGINQLKEFSAEDLQDTIVPQLMLKELEMSTDGRGLPKEMKAEFLERQKKALSAFLDGSKNPQEVAQALEEYFDDYYLNLINKKLGASKSPEEIQSALEAFKKNKTREEIKYLLGDDFGDVIIIEA